MYAANIPRIAALRELQERRTAARLTAERFYALLVQSGEDPETARDQAARYSAKLKESAHG